jgi:transposase
VLRSGWRWVFAGRDRGIEIVDEVGRRLAKRRLSEGLAGLSTLHALIAA